MKPWERDWCGTVPGRPRAHCREHDHWLTRDEDLRALVARDRLCPVLVRYRGASEGRFTAPAQDVQDLVEMLTATGRYVRDMSVTEREEAPAGWRSTT